MSGDLKDSFDYSEMHVLFSDDTLRRIRNCLIDGLRTDGAHHKQWYLERALYLTSTNCDEDNIIATLADWEPGIAP